MSYLRLALFVVLATPVLQARDGQAPAQAPTPNPFLIEKYASAVVVAPDGTLEQTSTTRVRIIEQAAVEPWGTVRVPFSRDLGSVDIRYVRVRKPDGRVVETPVSSAIDVPMPVTSQAPEYSDLFLRNVNVRALAVRDVLEMEVVQRRRPIFEGEFYFEEEFLLGQPVADGEFTLSVPAAMTVNIKARGTQPIVETRGGRRVYRWTFQRDAAMTPREVMNYLLSLRDQRPSVQVTSFESWANLGDKVLELWKDKAAVTPAIRQKAQELTTASTTEDEKIQAVYSFVAEKIRYVSVSFGVGQIRPHAADETLLNGFGDCKDKHVLIEALLSALGITAMPALITPALALDADVPSPAQFSHVITAVTRTDGSTVWFDGTGEAAPAGYLPASERDHSVLLLSAAGRSQIVKTPAEPVRPNTWTFDAEGSLDADGVFIGRISETLSGDHEVTYRDAYRGLTATETTERVKRLAFSANSATISDVTVENLDRVTGPLIVKYSVRQTGVVDWSRGELRWGLPGLWLDDPTEEDGTLPVTSDGYARTDRLRIKLIPGITATLPGNATVHRSEASAAFGEYSRSVGIEGDVVAIDRKTSVKPFFITTEGREDYAKFRTTAQTAIPVVSMHDTWPWWSTSTSTLGMPEPPAGKNAEANRLVVQMDPDPDVRIAAYTLGLALEPDHPALWGNVGTAQLAAGRFAEAIASYRKQLSVAPSRWLYRRAATMLGANRRYDDAILFYEEGIKAYPDDRNMAAIFGELLLTAGKNDRAAEVIRAEIAKRPRAARLHIALGRAEIRRGRTAEGVAALKRAIELENGPNMQNGVARELLSANVELELAFEYAERAVKTTATELVPFTNLANLPDGASNASGRMAGYMETYGRLLDLRGDRARAKVYCAAAWAITVRQQAAACLEAIAEKESDTATATRLRPMRNLPPFVPDPMTPTPEPPTGPNVGSLTNQAFQVRRAAMTKTLPRLEGVTASVRVTLLVDGSGVVRQITTGDRDIPAVRSALDGFNVGPSIPEHQDIRMRRTGTVACPPASGACTLTLESEFVGTGV